MPVGRITPPFVQLPPRLSELLWDVHWQQIHFWEDHSSADGYTWPHHQDCAVGIIHGYANNWAWCNGPLYILGPPHPYTSDYLDSLVDFDRKIRVIFWLTKEGDDPASKSRVMLMAKSTLGAPNPPTLNALGFGILIDNLALIGESYGSGGLGTVDLETNLWNGGEAVKVEIIHYPGQKIEYWIDDVLKGTQTDTTKIPSGVSSSATNAGGELYVTIKNGSSAGDPLFVHCTMPIILQDAPTPPAPYVFKEIATVTFDTNEDEVYAVAISGNYLYAGLLTAPGIIKKIDLTTFSVVGTLTLGVNEDWIYDLAISGGYLYAALDTAPGKIAKINLTTFTEEAVLTLASGENYAEALAIYGNYLYTGLWTSPGKVAKIDLTSFTQVDTLTFSVGENKVGYMTIADGYLYAGLYTTPGRIKKIDFGTFSVVGTLILDSGDDQIESLIASGGFLYAGLYKPTGPVKVVKINLTTFTKVATLQAALGGDGAFGLAVSGGALYVPIYNRNPGRIVKVDLDTFNPPFVSLGFQTGEACPYSLITSGNYLYAGLDTYPGKVVKVAIA